MNKQSLRADMRRRRKTLSEAEQRWAEQAVFAHLSAFEPYRQAKCVMAYAACRGELSLHAVVEDVLSSGKTLLLPRCEASGIMTARRIAGMEDLVPGMYGLLEPRADCAAEDPESIDLILVPGTAFDRTGNRIGQGAGYYDRFLKKTQALRAGICHEFSLLDWVPCEAHDMKMDVVITPGGIMQTHMTGGPEHG